MPRYIEQLNECTDPADADWFWIVDDSAGGTDKDRKVSVARFPRLAVANTFTAAQTINSTATNMLVLQRGGVTYIQSTTSGSANNWILSEVDLGDNVGPTVSINRNSNASTPSCGNLRMVNRAGTAYRIWPDASGNLRIGTTTPTFANDGTGTVVGTQTSWHELKGNIEEWDGADALEAIRSLTLYSYQMAEDGYQTPDGEKPTYKGIVITEDDRNGNAWFGLGYGENQVPVLNNRNLFGYILAAIQNIDNRLTLLEGN